VRADGLTCKTIQFRNAVEQGRYGTGVAPELRSMLRKEDQETDESVLKDKAHGVGAEEDRFSRERLG